MAIERVHALAGVCAKEFDFEVDRATIHHPLWLVAWPYGHVRVTIERSIGRVESELASAWRALAILQHAPTALIILSALKAENVNRKVHLGRAVSLEQTALVGTALTKRVAMLPHAMFMPSAL